MRPLVWKALLALLVLAPLPFRQALTLPKDCRKDWMIIAVVVGLGSCYQREKSVPKVLLPP